MSRNVGGFFCKSYCSGDLHLMFSPLQDDSGSTLTMTDVSVSDSGNISFPPSHFPPKNNNIILVLHVGDVGSEKEFSELRRILLSENIVEEHKIKSR